MDSKGKVDQEKDEKTRVVIILANQRFEVILFIIFRRFY